MLAELIDGRRREAADPDTWPLDTAARLLAIPPSATIEVAEEIDGVSFLLAGWHLARRVAEQHLRVVGRSVREAPRWRSLDLPSGAMAVIASGPVEVRATPDAPAMVLGIDTPDFGRPVAEVYLPEGHQQDGLAVLARWLEAARTADNPLRGAVLEVAGTSHGPLDVEVVELPSVDRSTLVLPDSAWQAVDTHVHGPFAVADRLAAAGLPTSRGVLLAGAPGVGKSALCRLLAAEVAAEVTVLIAAPATMGRLGSLYEEAVHLAPSVLILDDLDLAVGTREGGEGGLHQLLSAMDGVTPMARPVVTLATTNAPRAIDDAARRPGRLGVQVALPLPDAAGRRAILISLLARLDEQVEEAAIRRLVAVTYGFSGAGITQGVSAAVAGVEESSLVDRVVAMIGGGGADAAVGAYL